MAIVIDAKIKSGTVTASLGKLRDTLREINGAVAQLNANLGTTAANAGAAARSLKGMARASTSSGGGGGGGGGGSRGSGGLYGGYQKALRDQFNAKASGDPLAMSIANNQVLNQMNRLNKMAQVKKPPLTAHQSMINTSRVAYGPNGQMQMMPIVGRMVAAGMNPSLHGILDMAQMGMKAVHSHSSGFGATAAGAAVGSAVGAAGTEGAAAAATKAVMSVARIAIPIVAVIAAIKLFVKAVEFAQESLAKWSKSMVMGGGSPGTARAATVLGDALGIDVGAIGRNITPLGAARAGVNPFGGPFGDNNYNQKGISVLDTVRRMPTLDAARRYAESAGSPEAASAYMLSPDVYKMLRKTTQGQGSMENMRAAADLGGSFEALKNSLADIAIKVGAPVIKALAGSFMSLADAIGRIDSGHFKSAVVGLQATFDAVTWVLNGVATVMQKIKDMIQWILDKLGLGGSKSKDADDTKKAVKDGAREGVAQGIREGTFGGGSRANSDPRNLNPLFNPNYATPSYGVL